MKWKRWVMLGLATVWLVGCTPSAQQISEVPRNENITETTTGSTQRFVINDLEVSNTSHATMVLSLGESVFYVDPTGGMEQFEGAPAADVVLVTDIHGDHLDTETLEAVTGEAVLVVPQAVADELGANGFADLVVLANGEITKQAGVNIKAIPMYNVPETEEAPHINGRGNGYVLEAGGHRVYIAGDTGPTAEMKALTDIDVAFVPMNLPYTMSVEEAAEAVLAFAPRQVIPYHYRGQGGLSDIDEFKRLVNEGSGEIEVVFLEWY